MKITFVGTGYVGLVSAAGMSSFGHFVTCIDIDNVKIDKLKNLDIPIFENGLLDYIKKYGNTEYLSFKYGYDESLSSADAIFITVGTPQHADGSANLEYIFDAVLNSAKYAHSEAIFIIKSTVPPGTCAQLKDFLKQNGFNFEVVSNPEFLREGSAIHDFMNPDRIIIGSESLRATEIMMQVYKPFIDLEVSIVETDLITSELIKYASNSFLACKIAFINEMSDLCEVLGADINQLSIGMGLDKRISPAFLRAGPGFGGSCFPKDIMALWHLSKKLDSDFLILDAIINANANRPHTIMSKIKKIFANNIEGKKIAVLGLTYKAGTDDLRSSPSIDLIKLLWENGASVVAYDPQGIKNADKYFDDKLTCANSPFEAAKNADGLIIATEWQEFKDLDYAQIKILMNTPIIIELRNILNKQELINLGYSCYFIGQKNN